MWGPTPARFDFDIAANGTMVYIPAAPVDEEPRSLMWIDRSGKMEPLRASQRAYHSAYVSPDGTRIAADFRDEVVGGIWTLDIARETLTRLTFGPTCLLCARLERG